jgi:hypothetical protein
MKFREGMKILLKRVKTLVNIGRPVNIIPSKPSQIIPKGNHSMRRKLSGGYIIFILVFLIECTQTKFRK